MTRHDNDAQSASTDRRVRIGSLCTGVAGLDLGVAAALGGARLVWACDSAPPIQRFLAHRFPEAAVHDDVRTIDAATLGEVDVVTIGFPCTDVSISGRAAGLEKGTTSGEVWNRAVEVVGRLRPRLVVVENVAALRVKGRGLGTVLGSLARIGYDARWTSVRASDVGAPHRRERVFIAAYPHRPGRDPGPVLGRPAPGPGAPGRPSGRDPGGGRGERAGAWVQGELFPAPPQPPAPAPGRGPGPAGEAGPVCPLSLPRGWERYEQAIRRWEQVTGEPAPCPLEPGQRGNRRLAPAFSEWLMGLVPGWVTGPELGLTRDDQLRALGAAVVPQQAESALHQLLNDHLWTPPTTSPSGV